MPNYPTNPRLTPRNINFVPKTAGTSFVSPFSGQQQNVRYSGQWWELDLQYAPLATTDAEELFAFLLGLNGTETSFVYSLPISFYVAGTSTISVTGNGNTFTLSAGTTPVVGKFGVLSDGGNTGRLGVFTSTGSLFPRVSTGTKYMIKPTDSTYGSNFRLASNELNVSVDQMRDYGFAIGIREAI